MKRARPALVAVAVLIATLLASPVSARASAAPALSARAAALLDTSTGQPLYGINGSSQLAIASTTKLMTALLTLEHVHNLSRTFTQFDYVPASSDSQIGLVPGERMSVHDLLLALLLPSADDAAEDLAYNVGGGSVSNFVAMMNARARQLRLTDTHYATPSGLDTPGNYSSAWDLARLARYLEIHEPFFARAADLSHAVLHTGNYVRNVVNTNDLIGRVPWVTGVKTGHTLDAGYVLVASGERDGLRLVGAVLGTDSASARDANAVALLNWGFASFHRVQPLHAGQLLSALPVKDQPHLRAPVIASSTISPVVARDAHIRLQVSLPQSLTGPLPTGAVVGTVTVLAGSREIGTAKVLLARALPRISSLTVASRVIARPITLVLLVLLLGAVVAVAVRRRIKGRDPAGPEPA